MQSRPNHERLTDSPIHELGMTDTEYAALADSGYDPTLERMMIEAGSSPKDARLLTRVVGLVKDKPLETDEEWEEFLNVWESEAE
jgi:hypothetical protein